MQETPSPQTPQDSTTPPAQPPADDGIFKVQHGSAHNQPAAGPVVPPIQPGQTVQPDSQAELTLPPVDPAQGAEPVGSPDMSKIPQSLIYLATEAALPPAPPELEAAPNQETPPITPLPPTQ